MERDAARDVVHRWPLSTPLDRSFADPVSSLSAVLAFSLPPALTGTGAIWAYYSLLVRPKSMGLFSVSVALVAANGWNAYRRYRYEQQKKAQATTASTTQGLIPAATFAQKK
jgi:uncharacterized membrane protein YebE (DUF533 family)